VAETSVLVWDNIKTSYFCIYLKNNRLDLQTLNAYHTHISHTKETRKHAFCSALNARLDDKSGSSEVI